LPVIHAGHPALTALSATHNIQKTSFKGLSTKTRNPSVYAVCEQVSLTL